MNQFCRLCFITLIFAVGLARLAAAQTFDEKFEHWPIDLKINGNIIIGGPLDDPSILKNVLRQSAREKRVTVLLDHDANESLVARYKAIFKEDAKPKPDADKPKKESDKTKKGSDKPKTKGDKTKTEDDKPKTETAKPKQVERPITVARTSGKLSDQISSLLKDCEIFCCHLSKQLTEEQRMGFSDSAEAFWKHINAGGTVIVIGPQAELLGKQQLTAKHTGRSVRLGLGLVPDCVIDTNYTNTPVNRGQLLSVLATHPRSVGVGVEKNTLLILSGRKMYVVGSGKATFLLMANERQPIRIQTIASRQSRRRQLPQEFLVDLTEWRRDAIDRTIDQFPPVKPETPFVENGSLVIVGGGGMPKGLMTRFIELAGGNENAKLIYVPCEERDELSAPQRTVEAWKRMGVKNATSIHTKDRNKANDDAEFLAPLKDATGIWFGGGRQWNLADSYYGTQAHKLMKDVLKRGGVIGGSSAGASIQGRYLARATPIGNFRIMAPGYERGGLGFLSGVAIDQHFSQRRRQKNMTQLVNRYPQLLGIGLDEATAIIVQKSVADVVGRGKAHFYDRNLPVYPDRPDYVALPKGSSYNLAERKILKDTTEIITSPVEPKVESKKKL